NDGKRFLRIGFSNGILKQPLKNYARIEHDDHGRSAARALRTSLPVTEGRL
ncbi:MAG: hypothetical protein QOF42_2927, partial [Gammaproteobacteria bacterium]|nr:hypothetical protein [Gammaproteobacteria bacterium]